MGWRVSLGGQVIRTYNLCLLGFGNVNRALVRLLEAKNAALGRRGIGWRVTGIASRRLGWIADESGLEVDRLGRGETGTSASAPHVTRVGEWLQAAGADVLFEATSLAPRSGQPAIEHIRAALEHGAHAITANKGPVVHAWEELQALARARGRRFLCESTVMDGAPIFSLFRESLPVIELRGFHGVLNSTTNVILGGMEAGLSFEESLGKAQELGVAETDARHDLEGWDAAVKVAALVRVLMGERIELHDIRREGIVALNGEVVRAARDAGTPYKLVCEAHRGASGVDACVGPQRVSLSDPLAHVRGTSSILH